MVLGWSTAEGRRVTDTSGGQSPDWAEAVCVKSFISYLP